MGLSGVLLLGHGALGVAAGSRGWAWSVGVTMASAVCVVACLFVGSVLGGMYPSVGV